MSRGTHRTDIAQKIGGAIAYPAYALLIGCLFSLLEWSSSRRSFDPSIIVPEDAATPSAGRASLGMAARPAPVPAHHLKRH